MLRELSEQTPQLLERARSFCADRGLDEEKLRVRRFDDYGILSVIDNCNRWQIEKKQANYDPNQPITRALYPDRADNIVYDNS